MKYAIFDMHKDINPCQINETDMGARYRYSIEFRLIQGGGMMYFHDVRKWMVDTYGWSDQLGNAVTNTDNEYWAWTVNHDSYRIYLRSDKELMFFKLRFSINDMV